MKEKKYILTNENIRIRGHILCRIQAVKDFSDVHAGDLGGFIESEENLSHLDTCWVYDDAAVFRYALIYGNAKVKGTAVIYGNAVICDDAIVEDQAEIYGDAKVRDSAKVTDYSTVRDSAVIFNEALISENAIISQNAKIGKNAIITECGRVSGNARICNNGYIRGTRDHICIGPIGSRNDYLTFYRTKTSEIYVTTGCFCGPLDMFRRAVMKTYPIIETAQKAAKDKLEIVSPSGYRDPDFRKEYLEIAKYVKNTYFKRF